MEQLSEFKYLDCVLHEKVAYGAECRTQVLNFTKVAGAMKSLVNGNELPLGS